MIYLIQSVFHTSDGCFCGTQGARRKFCATFCARFSGNNHLNGYSVSPSRVSRSLGANASFDPRTVVLESYETTLPPCQWPSNGRDHEEQWCGRISILSPRARSTQLLIFQMRSCVLSPSGESAYMTQSIIHRPEECNTVMVLCSTETRRTWLILPVVICLFQGLSHANVRVPVLRYRGVCVRLIIRLIVYPTKDVFLTFRRDNCANCTANTTGEDSATIKPVSGGNLPCWGLGSCWPKQRPTPLKRQV